MDYIDVLGQLYNEDPSIVVITAENRALIRDLEKRYPQIPFIDVGIAEQTAVGVSAGLAKSGMKPIVHGLASFLTMRSYEFIRTDIALPKLNVKFVGFIPGLLSEANGPTHQAIQDLALMQTMPGMNIFLPSDYEDMLECLPEIIKNDGPSYIRANHIRSGVNHSRFIIPESEKIRSGSDITILSYGPLLEQSNKLCDRLIDNCIYSDLYNIRSFTPFDKKLLRKLYKENKPIIVIEDHLEFGSLYNHLLTISKKDDERLNLFPINLGNNYHKPLLLKDLMAEDCFSINNLYELIIDFIKDPKLNKA